MSKETLGRRDFLKISSIGLASILFGGCVSKDKTQNPNFARAVIPKDTPTLKPTQTPKIITPTENPTYTPTATTTEIPTQTPVEPAETPVFIPKNEIIGSIETNKNEFVLSIDDGWFPDVFDSMIGLLRQNNSHATFFLIWQAAQNLGHDRLAQAVADGNEIGYHSLYHPELSAVKKMSYADWKYDYQTWQNWMKGLLGPELYTRGVKQIARAPYGEFTPGFIKMCANFNLPMVAWDKEDFDVAGKDPQKGDIVLLHVIPTDLGVLDHILAISPVKNVSFTEIIE